MTATSTSRLDAAALPSGPIVRSPSTPAAADGAAAAGPRQAFFIFFAAMLEGPDWPVGFGQHTIVTPVRRKLKTNRTYGLLVSRFYF